MFILAIAAAAVVVGIGIAAIDNAVYDSGGSFITKQPATETTTSEEPAIEPTVSNVKKKAKLTRDGEKIIGLKDGSLVKAQPTLTTVDFDTSTYGDRAVLQLRNDTGSSVTLTGLSIRGKPVKQLSGQNGYVWEYSDYDDIEKNGENYVEVSNDFIFSPLQARSIGDFVWKELHPHKMYQLTLVGMQYQYEIGQIWHLTLNYTLDGRTMENIDTDVEVMGVSMSRSAGDLGATVLSLRVPSAAWELTLSKNAKLVGAGNSQRLNNRSNIVTVAASTWTGQADYFCDGTNDEVEIQAAIDYIYSIGGGRVILTTGEYYISNTIIIKLNIILSGNGSNTILIPYSNSFLPILSGSGYSNFVISDFSINGNSEYILYGISLTGIIDLGNNGFCNNINIYNFKYASTSGSSGIGFILFKNINNASNCVAYSNYGINSSGNKIKLVCFYNCSNCIQCITKENIVYGTYGGITGFHSCSLGSLLLFTDNTLTDVNGELIGFESSSKLTNCSAISNYPTSTILYFSFYSCKSLQQCRADSTYKYDACYADSGSSNACADTAAGGYNS